MGMGPLAITFHLGKQGSPWKTDKDKGAEVLRCRSSFFQNTDGRTSVVGLVCGDTG